jgi:hypothetical protein
MFFLSQRDITLKNIRPRVLYDAYLGVAGCGLRSVGAGTVLSCVQTVDGEPTLKLPCRKKTEPELLA